MALDFILQRLLYEAERIDVLDFSLRAKFFLSPRPHADVGIAAQRAFLHVAVADPGIKNDFFETREVLVRFLRRSHVGFADDLGERHTGSVQIDGSLVGGIGEALVQALSRVFFEVQASDADLFLDVIDIDADESELGQRLVVLRNLVALWQVGIKIILARKNRDFIDAALQSHCREGRELHRLLIQHWQSSRKSQTDGADIGVWRIAKAGGARAEDFRRSEQLNVDFEPDYRFVFCQ